MLSHPLPKLRLSGPEWPRVLANDQGIMFPFFPPLFFFLPLAHTNIPSARSVRVVGRLISRLVCGRPFFVSSFWFDSSVGGGCLNVSVFVGGYIRINRGLVFKYKLIKQ